MNRITVVCWLDLAILWLYCVLQFIRVRLSFSFFGGRVIGCYILFVYVCFYLWSPYVIGRPYIFSSCFFFLLLLFFSSPNLSGRKLDVYHTLAHGVALVRI